MTLLYDMGIAVKDRIQITYQGMRDLSGLRRDTPKPGQVHKLSFGQFCRRFLFFPLVAPYVLCARPHRTSRE